MDSRKQKLRRISTLAVQDPREFARRVKVRISAEVATASAAASRALSAKVDLKLEQRKTRAAFLYHFGRHGQPAPELSFGLTRDLPFGFDVSIERDGNRFRILISSVSPEFSLQWLKHRVPCYAYWLAVSPPEVRRVTVTLGDGNNPMSGQFAPSTNLERITAIPDPYFFENNAFAMFRDVSMHEAPAWSDRSSVLMWRGATTGGGFFNPELAFERPELTAQRLHACSSLLGIADTDVKFAYSTHADIPIESMERFGLRGEKVEESTWVSRKYALDMDGNSNSWQNLIVRLHLGCCVLKVASRYGFHQWYYDRLKPWEHYVPVAADLSDLLERIEWVRANDREAAEIARRGQAFARTLTWEAVEAEAVELITANWNRPQPA